MHQLRIIVTAFCCVVFATITMAQVVAPTPHPRIARDGDPTPAQNPAIQNTTPNSPNLQIPAPSIPTPNQPVSLSARIEEGGTLIPNGLIWRIFATQTDNTGELPMLARSEEATAAFELPVGEYMVHVSYGRAQSSETVFVEIGPNIHSIVLEAGAIVLNSAINAEISIPPRQLRFDILTDGLDGDDIPVAMNIEQNSMVHLNAGTYKIVSRWGLQNAIVRADIRVEPGEVTEATLFHKAAEVTFSLVSKTGGEAIADVDWKVQNADGEELFSHLGAFPTTVLAEGDYSVFAQSGETVYNRQFQVLPGRPVHFEVLTTVF